MRIFISHASKDKELVLKFSNFLESLDVNIEVFCSSVTRSIRSGSDYVQYIVNELNNSDVFIPIISSNYYASKFCMIELGFAYSALYNLHSKNNEDYIFPFCIPPIQKGSALSGTPLATLQIEEITDVEGIRSFIDSLIELKKCKITSGSNRRINSFVSELDQLLLKNFNIFNNSELGVFFDHNTVSIKNPKDFVSYSLMNEEITVNYNFDPYDMNDTKPSFISFVFRYADKLDLNKFIKYDELCKFSFELFSFTNSIKNMNIEFKFSDNIRILKTYSKPIVSGKNVIEIELHDMQSKALQEISEICFVLHPFDVVEKEGMYKISNIKIQ